MKIIDLDRHFIKYHKDSDIDLELASVCSSFNWDKLLTVRRIVLLAEAGSGKSIELKEQAHLLNMEDCFAFYVTVEDVGRDGLTASLTPSDLLNFNQWKLSNKLAYLFIDSVDEA